MHLRPLLFLLAAGCRAQDALPLQTGNQWVYQQTSGLGGREAWIVTVGSPQSIGGREYFPLSGYLGRDPLLVRRAGTAVVFYDETERRERPWADFGAAPNERFPSEIDSCNSSAVISAREPVKLAIGEFTEAPVLTYRTTCADAGILEEVFVPGVGLAKRTYSTIAGPRTFELIYARIGGFSVYSQGEHAFHLTLDGYTYRRGAAITARITLRNTTAQPLELVFPSGQDFDIVIRNEAGQQVWRWSDGRAFTLAIRTVSFTGERHWVEGIRLDLPPGNYTAVGSLAIQDRKYESTLAFRIEPAQ